ncbi:hypothetical protein Fcan01_16306 [Folsomia candida]|uniref:Uncharacterized protein n=1 Tax=Folsomia candida TaxID=158441 RepID=A0A226DUX1_FOLCA|nr:hypothetical protein Fcan01_16306 [Folsomia candida]
MYTTQFHNLMVRHLGLCRLLKCVPAKYDANLKKIVPIDNPRDIKIFRIQCIISLVYTTAMFLNLCVGPLTIPKKFQGVSFFGIYFLLLFCKWNYRLDIAPIQVINSFVLFEKSLEKGG